jgi:hypothetical protein
MGWFGWLMVAFLKRLDPKGKKVIINNDIVRSGMHFDAWGLP